MADEEKKDTDDVLEITLSRKEIRLTIDRKPYKLVEMMSNERDKYLSEVASRMRADIHGNSTVRNFDGMFALLIAKCLIDEESGKLVPQKYIETEFPATAQKVLFEKCQKLNGLSKEDAEDEKKS